jgi:AraC-like DNA-binding protein
MNYDLTNEADNTNTDILYDAIRKFNSIVPNISNDYFKLDIFYSRIITNQHLSSPDTRAPHKHSFYELIIPVCGTASYEFKKSNLNLFKGKFCLTVPNTTHHLTKHTDDFAALTFGFNFLSPDALSLPIKTDREFFELNSSPYLLNGIMHILNLAESSENGYYQRINMQLQLLLFDIINRIEPMRIGLPHINDEEKSETVSDDTRLRAAMQYISDNINSDILVDDVAAAAGVCSRQLNRILISSIGISTNELINRIRIRTAKKYMESNTIPLSQISEKCGFNSLTSFSRTFKKITGVAPKFYKKDKNTSP